jgi:hypothetical protein
VRIVNVLEHDQRQLTPAMFVPRLPLNEWQLRELVTALTGSTPNLLQRTSDSTWMYLVVREAPSTTSTGAILALMEWIEQQLNPAMPDGQEVELPEMPVAKGILGSDGTFCQPEHWVDIPHSERSYALRLLVMNPSDRDAAKVV